VEEGGGGDVEIKFIPARRVYNSFFVIGEHVDGKKL
jgi:hypothetical protein